MCQRGKKEEFEWLFYFHFLCVLKQLAEQKDVHFNSIANQFSNALDESIFFIYRVVIYMYSILFLRLQINLLCLLHVPIKCFFSLVHFMSTN